MKNDIRFLMLALMLPCSSKEGLFTSSYESTMLTFLQRGVLPNVLVGGQSLHVDPSEVEVGVVLFVGLAN